jgi:chemotaxis protein CheD
MQSPGFPFEVWLQPGEFAVAHEGCQIRTLLGSCVSVTLWHRKRRVGAMSHFLLWSRPRRDSGKPLDARYGEEAVPMMFEQLAVAHAPLHECEAKIFGGGKMFRDWSDRSGAGSVGEQNGRAARLLLQQMKVEVVAESLFGHGRRNIIFDVGTGDVWVRQGSQELGQEVLA